MSRESDGYRTDEKGNIQVVETAAEKIKAKEIFKNMTYDTQEARCMLLGKQWF